MRHTEGAAATVGGMFDTTVAGPFYEDFVTGATLPPLPPVTLTEADNTLYRAITGDQHLDRKSTRLNSSHIPLSRMPSSA